MKRTFIVAAVALVALALAIVAFVMITKDKKKEKFSEVETVPKAASAKSKQHMLKVMLFYATWCPHCERYLQTQKFDGFADAVKQDTSIKANVTFEKVDYDKNQTLGDRYGISAFPTIIAVDDDEKVYRFNGDRSKDSHMVQFVKAALSKQTLSSTDYS